MVQLDLSPHLPRLPLIHPIHSRSTFTAVFVFALLDAVLEKDERRLCRRVVQDHTAWPGQLHAEATATTTATATAAAKTANPCQVHH